MPYAAIARGSAAVADAGHPVVVVGAGPVGLTAAAHLVDRGLPVLVLEQGSTVGASVQEWGHIRTFTPWQYIVDPVAERLLVGDGWQRPSTDVPPTGDELIQLYLRPLAAVLGSSVVQMNRRVTGISREGVDKTRTVGRELRPFVVRTVDAQGGQCEVLARAVIDASGTWTEPNPVGATGLPAVGEKEAIARNIVVGPLPDVLGADRSRFANRRVLVVGMGHSAANTLLALAQLAVEEPETTILWAIRGASPVRLYGGEAADALAARGQLGSDLRRLVESGVIRLIPNFSVEAIIPDPTGPTVDVRGRTATGVEELHAVSVIVAATGFRPDLEMLREVRLDLDPGLEAPRQLAPLIDPNFHSCGTVRPHGHRELAQPEHGFYLAGMKSYGRAPTFLITTGNEQVRSIVAAMAGDMRAADEVQLVLPETGVCSVNLRPTAAAAMPEGGPGAGDGGCAVGDAPACDGSPHTAAARDRTPAHAHPPAVLPGV